VDDIRESSYIRKLHDALADLHQFDIEFQNGGTHEELKDYFNRLWEFDVVLWFVNVPNVYEKIALKEKNPRMILVTSKNNLDSRYSYMELIAKMLSAKSNLMVEFNKSGVILASVLDPLGNAYIMKESDISKLAFVLAFRILTLLGFTRIGSQRIAGEAIIPNQPEFFQVGRELAETFHSLIHPEHTERFLGNMSFRCEHGFPSFREGDRIYVSRRNFDKRQIDANGFVALEATAHNPIEYYGDAKPSVDAPIQLELYSTYRNVFYMIHSHVYVEGALFTDHPVPCGAVEEVDEIAKIMWDEQMTNMPVNLRGHGSIVFAAEPSYFKTIKYMARPCPEKVPTTLNGTGHLL